MVSVFPLYSNNLSLNPPEAYTFFCRVCLKNNQKKQKEAGFGPFNKIKSYFQFFYTSDAEKADRRCHARTLSLSLWWNKEIAITEICAQRSVWPDLAIFRTLGNFLKPLATINLAKSPTFLGNFCKGFKIYPFSSEIILGQLL